MWDNSLSVSGKTDYYNEIISIEKRETLFMQIVRQMETEKQIDIPKPEKRRSSLNNRESYLFRKRIYLCDYLKELRKERDKLYDAIDNAQIDSKRRRMIVILRKMDKKINRIQELGLEILKLFTDSIIE